MAEHILMYTLHHQTHFLNIFSTNIIYSYFYFAFGLMYPYLFKLVTEIIL